MVKKKMLRMNKFPKTTMKSTVGGKRLSLGLHPSTNLQESKAGIK